MGEGGEAVGLSMRINGGGGEGARLSIGEGVGEGVGVGVGGGVGLSIGGDDSGGERVGLCRVNERGVVLTASDDDERGGDHWCC